MSATPSPPTFVYKIFRDQEWEAFLATPAWPGSADDLADGFIHLSSAEQVAGSVSRHFAGEPHLVLARFHAAELGDKLVMEPSRSGQAYPHLYTSLSRDLLDAAQEFSELEHLTAFLLP